MKQKMIEFLENNHFANGRDFEIIKDFIEEFFGKDVYEKMDINWE